MLRFDNVNITEKIAYWVDIAGYDLETARAMLSSGRYLYAVFMGGTYCK